MRSRAVLPVEVLAFTQATHVNVGLSSCGFPSSYSQLHEDGGTVINDDNQMV